MGLMFWFDCDPSDTTTAEVAALAPTNPLCTPAYVRAKQALGIPTWLVGLRAEHRLVWAAPALVRPRGELELETVPSEPPPEFWDGLRAFCGKRGLGFLEVCTMASPVMTLPRLAGEQWRRRRVEHVLPLKGRDLWAEMWTDQRRYIKRARKAGVVVRCVTDPAACREHARLVALAMQRRKERGESVPDDIRPELYEPYLRTGAGVLFEAVRAGEVLSSGLMLLSERAAYNLTTGTGPEGLACGASPCMVYEAARTLQERGLEVLNLGIANPDNAGLYRYKVELGAVQVELDHVGYYVHGRLGRAWRAGLKAVRQRVRGLFRGTRLA